MAGTSGVAEATRGRMTRGIAGGERFAEARLVAEPVFLMNRLGSLGSAIANQRLREHGLKVRQYSLLSLVCEPQAPTQREISEFLVLDPSQVVALVDELEGRGLLRREPDPRDRRSKILVPTDEGRGLLERAEADVDAATDELLTGLEPAQRAQLQELLASISV